ncbi:aspartate aminotransferase family protein, partial [Candidatus Woesearchaeota archaeon]
YFNAGPVNNFAAALNSDTEIFAKYFCNMLDAGISLAPSQFETGFMSIAHCQDDLDQTIEAARKAIRAL